METLEERIRRRAYELWEQAGCTGDPEDHWFRAERELGEGARNGEQAIVQETPPVQAVEAMEAVEGTAAAAPAPKGRGGARAKRGS